MDRIVWDRRHETTDNFSLGNPPLDGTLIFSLMTVYPDCQAFVAILIALDGSSGPGASVFVAFLAVVQGY